MNYHIDTLEVLTNENGDTIVQFPNSLIEELGWGEGDDLEWIVNDDGTVTVIKKESEPEKEWVLVETVQMFRHRYVVQVPNGKKDYALDTVTLNQAKEFSQLHLGETIVSHRVITEDEAIAQCYADNEYVSSWNEDTMKKEFFTYYGLDNGKLD
jgi:bifunctional DNA-binding transcriptional regulator/antitoxin component of YhaV-PrlF toxin-antitoxin module